MTEYLEMGDLKENLRFVDASFPLPEPKAKAIVRQIATAFHVLHGKNIVHRDLKLSNVLIKRGTREELTYVLADMGSAVKLGADR